MNDYKEQANNFLEKTNTQFNAKYLKHDYHFNGDDEKRDIYKIELKRGCKSYSFEFGQSIVNRYVEPSPYDVLACLTKHDPYSFNNFCNEYGYNNDSIRHKNIYDAVKKEYGNLTRLFDCSELKQLQQIN